MANPLIRSLVLLAAACGLIGVAAAQDLGTLDPKPLPPLDHPDDPHTAARDLFGRKPTPAAGPARSIGFYTNGCLSGGAALPINGPTWQVMRLSRNRNWGHPNLISFLERFSKKAHAVGWNGLLVGDMSQPRGGPMLTGHWSHQVGLDSDIWFTPMPDHEQTRQEREDRMATNIVADDWTDVNPVIWSPTHIALLKAAAEDRAVERVLVNPAIKKALCRDVHGDRAWLAKIRPFYGHNYHFHVRLGCPAGSNDCRKQPAISGRDECGKELDWWFTPKVREPPHGDSRPLPISAMSQACRRIVAAP